MSAQTAWDALAAGLGVALLIAAPATWRRVRRVPWVRRWRRDVALLADRPAKWGRR